VAALRATVDIIVDPNWSLSISASTVLVSDNLAGDFYTPQDTKPNNNKAM